MKLSDTQLILLSKAAKRDDRAVQLPAHIDSIAADKLVSKLAGSGLIEEIESRGVLPIWRRVNDTAFTLRITDAGLKAVGVDEAVPPRAPKQAIRKASIKTNNATTPGRAGKASPSSKASKSRSSKKTKKIRSAAQMSARRSGTKHDQILNLLRGKGGVSIAEMQKVSGWQAHSVRGFLSGTVKKRLGLKVQSSVSKDRERRYSVAG